MTEPEFVDLASMSWAEVTPELLQRVHDALVEDNTEQEGSSWQA